MLNGLDLFSGISGLTVALAPWVRPIAYCELDPYCQAVLLSRMSCGELPIAPIWDDVRSLSFDELKRIASIDIIYGGFPCQDISIAGNGKGLDGERSGLVSHVFRLAEDLSPPFVFLENVPAIKSRGAERICKELAGQGYDLRWDVISAAEVGASHLRKRWFCLAAHPKRLTVRDQSEWQSWGCPNAVQRARESELMDDGKKVWRQTIPEICTLDDGLPEDVDEFRALGNAVVPLQAREAFKQLMGL